MSSKFSMRYLLIALLLTSVLAQSSWANCTPQPNSPPSHLYLPLPQSINVPADAPIGFEIWDSQWQTAQNISVDCTAESRVTGELPAGVNEIVPIAGERGIYKTSTDGIGIDFYWCNSNSNCPTDKRRMARIAAIDWTARPIKYNLPSKWRVRLVKTGPIVSDRPLQVVGRAVMKYGNAEASALYLTGSSPVTTSACQINPDSRTITVPMPTVHKDDFPVGTGVLTDNTKARDFKINLICDNGVAVHYKIEGASRRKDVLENAQGTNMASGVGIQLFQGDRGSTRIYPLTEKVSVIKTNQNNQMVSIPLSAKYYKTENSIQGGEVSVSATFTLTYE